MKRTSLFSSNLQYFATLYRTLNYSKSAKIIPITYQGLKKAIRALEQELDVRLFEQGANNDLIPTEQADMLYERIRLWNLDTRRLEESLAAVSFSQRKVVRLGTTDGTHGYFGLGMEEAFAAEHPSLTLKVVEYADLIIDQALLDCEFNLALTVAPFNPAFETTTLASTPYIAWVSKEHRLAGREKLLPEDFDGETLITLDTNVKIPEHFQNLFDRMGVQLRSTIDCSEVIWIYIYALENCGLGLCVEHVGDALLGNEGVVAIPIECDASWTFGVSHLRDHVLTEDEQAVVDFLVRRAAERQRHSRASGVRHTVS